MKDLSIIVVSFNTKKMTLECLESIRKYTKNIGYEIIVVDNNSVDGSVDAITDLGFKDISIIKNKVNKGFGAANNQGINNANSRYVLLLNSDTIIQDNVLAKMITYMDKHPKTAVSSCALLNKDGSIQGTGGFFPTISRVFSWMFFIEDIPYADVLIKPFHPIHGQSFLYDGTKFYKKSRSLDWVTGAFMMVRTDILQSVGGFDEDYFMYTEEVDLCYRIKKLGWNVDYVSEESIVHLGSASSTKEFSLLEEYKSIKLFYRKHMPKLQYPILRFFLKCGALLRIVLFRIIKGKEVSKTYVKAFKMA